MGKPSQSIDPAELSLPTPHTPPTLRRTRQLASGWWGGLALVALALCFSLPGLRAIGPIDRDESRFAQASRQMFEAAALPHDQLDLRTGEGGRPLGAHSGGWAIPMVQETPRLNKPPLIYWLQAASAWLFTAGHPERDAIWMYRVPSVVCALASVLLTWRLGLRLYDGRVAWTAAALLAICPLIVFDAHQARADQLLLTTTLAGQIALHNLWRNRRGAWLLVWPAVAMGILAKGPIAPLILILTAILLSAWGGGLGGGWGRWGGWGWLKRSRPVIGLLILAALVGPWLWAVGERVGWENYFSLVYAETLGRAGGSSEGHWGPPGFHAVLATVLFWPGSLVTLAAVIRAWKIGSAPASPRRLAALFRRTSGRPAEFFLLCWLVPGWLFFDLFGAKLAHYPMPLYPALALLTARFLVAARPGTAFHRAPGNFGWLVWTSVFAAFGVGLLLPGFYGWYHGTEALVGFAVLIAAALAVSRRREPLCHAMIPAALALALASGFTLLFWGPTIVPGAVASRITTSLADARIAADRPLAATQRRDSLVFLTRGRIVTVDPVLVPLWIAENPHGVLIHRAGAENDPVPAALSAAGWRELPTIQGLTLERAERGVWRLWAGPAPTSP